MVYFPDKKTCAVFVIMLNICYVPWAEAAQNVYMFGDSSSDIGNYRIDGVFDRPINDGLLWIESVSRKYGVASTPGTLIDVDTATPAVTISGLGGNNYATSGGTVLNWGRFASYTFNDQIDWFVADHASFKKDDVIFVSFDSNDPSEAILQGLTYSPNDYADAYVNGIKRLKSLGASDVIAMGDTLANLTPDAYSIDLITNALIANGVPAGSAPAIASTLVDQYKQDILSSRSALWPKLKEQNVYIVDLSKVAQDINDHPNRYGFYQGSDATLSCTNCPSDGYVFTNDGHYTSATQSIFSNYTIGQLRARDQYVTMLTKQSDTMDLSTREIMSRSDYGAFFRQNDHFEVSKREVGDWVIGTGAHYGESQQKSDGGVDVGLDSDRNSAQFFGDVLVTDSVLIGGQFYQAHTDGQFEESSGKFSQDIYSAALYSTWAISDQLYLNTIFNYGYVSYDDISRQVNLSPGVMERASGTTRGDNYSARAALGYQINFDQWALTPEVGVKVQRATIKGYNEKSSVIGMSYGDSSYDSVRGSVGLKAAMTGGRNQIRPYAGFNVDHNFLDDPIKVQVGPSENLLVDYKTNRPAETAGHALVGADYQINEHVVLDINARIDQDFGKSTKDPEIGGYVGLKILY